MRDPYDRYDFQERRTERDEALDALEYALFTRYSERKAAYLRVFDNMRAQMEVDRAVRAFGKDAA